MLFTIQRDKDIYKSAVANENRFDYSYSTVDYRWYIKGSLFYLFDVKGRCISKDEIDYNALDSLIVANGFDAKLIKERVEGHYVCMIVRKDEIIIFGDKFNRLNLFFTRDRESFYFDTFFSKELIEKGRGEINDRYLYSYFLLGYAHSTLTLFKDIKRLAHDEVLLYDGDLAIKNIFSPTHTENYETGKIKEFDDLFYQSVRSRMGKGTNFMSNSGGWDSTLILDVLLKLTDKKYVKSATFKTKMRDGRVNNVYEVEKTQRIAKHYDIEHFIFEVDMADSKLIDKWVKYSTGCFSNHIFQWPINHYGIVDFIKDLDSSTEAIFNGECADSFQNFGFSQYASIHSGIHSFDEYADKMKTYLYGPSFMKEVLNNTFKSNKIYQIFKGFYTNINFEDTINDYFNVMFSFIFSPSRLPFSLPENLNIFHENSLNEFYHIAVNDYFKKYSEWIKPKFIYSVWSALYSDFHFKGLSVPMSIRSIEEGGFTAGLPYYDLCLANFFTKMPESWGRGLNLNTVKYPEKKMATNSKTYPLHIVNENKTHSYLSENDHSLNPFYEYYCNSTITNYFRDILADKSSLDFLNADGIQFDRVEQLRERFLNGKSVAMEDFPIISKICILSSILYEGMRI